MNSCMMCRPILFVVLKILDSTMVSKYIKYDEDVGLQSVGILNNNPYRAAAEDNRSALPHKAGVLLRSIFNEQIGKSTLTKWMCERQLFNT